jgi:hypothetical protein
MFNVESEWRVESGGNAFTAENAKVAEGESKNFFAPLALLARENFGNKYLGQRRKEEEMLSPQRTQSSQRGEESCLLQTSPTHVRLRLRIRFR